jgi:hypothetical protein
MGKGTRKQWQRHRVNALLAGSIHGIEQVVLQREEGRARTRGDADLVVDVLNVVPDGFLGDDEPLRHLSIREAARDQTQHLYLAVTQVRWPDPARRAFDMACRSQHRVHCILVEPVGADLVAQALGGVFGGARRSVRAALGHRMVHVGGGQHTGL